MPTDSQDILRIKILATKKLVSRCAFSYIFPDYRYTLFFEYRTTILKRSRSHTKILWTWCRTSFPTIYVVVSTFRFLSQAFPFSYPCILNNPCHRLLWKIRRTIVNPFRIKRCRIEHLLALFFQATHSALKLQLVFIFEAVVTEDNVRPSDQINKFRVRVHSSPFGCFVRKNDGTRNHREHSIKHKVVTQRRAWKG